MVQMPDRNDDRQNRQKLRDAANQCRTKTLKSMCFEVFMHVDMISNALKSGDNSVARKHVQLARECARLLVTSSTSEFAYYKRLDDLLTDAVEIRTIKKITALPELPQTDSDIATVLLQCITVAEEKLGTYILRNKKKGVFVYKELGKKSKGRIVKNGLHEERTIRRNTD